ncbi:DNA mismatch repair protein [Leucoagaricus gongylophorus]
MEQELLWLKALRSCPRSLLDLVNLKACRGAIMFNDSLTLAQCEGLVQRLALTAFPFQCAHGRPSLVPLIELDPQTGKQRRAPPCDWSKLEVMG